MESVNQNIELWADPQTGVALPFVDIRLVSGRLEYPDRIFTYLNGEMNGQPCTIQLAYWRWPQPTDWVEQTEVRPSAVPDIPPPPDFEPEPLPGMETFVYAPSPVFVSNGRSLASQVQQAYAATLGMGLMLWGLVWLLLRIWRWLLGGG